MTCAKRNHLRLNQTGPHTSTCPRHHYELCAIWGLENVQSHGITFYRQISSYSMNLIDWNIKSYYNPASYRIIHCVKDPSGEMQLFFRHSKDIFTQTVEIISKNLTCGHSKRSTLSCTLHPVP